MTTTKMRKTKQPSRETGLNEGKENFFIGERERTQKEIAHRLKDGEALKRKNFTKR